MPEQYTVTDVSAEVKDWKAQGRHPMKEYRVHLDGPGGPYMNVEWSRKVDSPAPTQGQVILVDRIEDRGQHGYKLHLATQQGGYQGGGEDPKRQASIIRQHSQTAALTVLTLKQQLGVLTADDLTPAKIQQLADFFDDDVRHGVQRSEKAA